VRLRCPCSSMQNSSTFPMRLIHPLFAQILLLKINYTNRMQH
jgi:hypothetical protein